MDIKFNNIIEDGYLGRNGAGKIFGMHMWTDTSRNIIWIEPLNSRGQVGRCWIRIPKEHLQDLIDTLEKLK